MDAWFQASPLYVPTDVATNMCWEEKKQLVNLEAFNHDIDMEQSQVIMWRCLWLHEINVQYSFWPQVYGWFEVVRQIF